MIVGLRYHMAVQPPTVSEAHAQGERALQESRFEDALALFVAALESQPEHLDLRLRVADALLALGQVQCAAIVYTTLARYAAHAGHPLLALVAIKILSTLAPALSPLVNGVAELYAADSGRIGVGVRAAISTEDVPLAQSVELLRTGPREVLFQRAEVIGGAHANVTFPEVHPPIPLLSELTRDDFVAVLHTVTLVRRRPGDVVLRQGEPGHGFYMVARGDLAVVREGASGTEQLATLHEGAVFGEMALLSKSPRSADVRATSSADLLEFHVAALNSASQGTVTIAVALDKFTRERLVSNLIATAPLFRPLDRNQRLDLVRRFVGHEVAQQTDIIREGEPGRGLYVVLHGSVDVWKRDGDEKVLLATLGAGDVFGEMSLLQDAPAAASVTAATRSTVLFLAREYVDRLLSSMPAMRTYLETLGDERALDTRLWLDVTTAS
jgi:CRP-like cAMP-binding protein